MNAPWSGSLRTGSSLSFAPAASPRSAEAPRCSGAARGGQRGRDLFCLRWAAVCVLPRPCLTLPGLACTSSVLAMSPVLAAAPSCSGPPAAAAAAAAPAAATSSSVCAADVAVLHRGPWAGTSGTACAAASHQSPRVGRPAPPAPLLPWLCRSCLPPLLDPSPLRDDRQATSCQPQPALPWAQWPMAFSRLSSPFFLPCCVCLPHDSCAPPYCEHRLGLRAKSSYQCASQLPFLQGRLIPSFLEQAGQLLRPRRLVPPNYTPPVPSVSV